ncbi:Protein phosphatase methylesterase 1 [Aphelenchoides besseyi]|nr:Protein phosphatase methylesterase 1 [Aphelenchoides besseyi]
MGHDFSPLLWNEFFDEKRVIEINDDQFTVYVKGNSGPVFLLLHGGGYSGLTWACLTEELSKKIECMIVAPDLRGHGETTTSDDENLSTAQQIQDISAIYKQIFGEMKPPTLVIGHSMGGALAVHLVDAKLLSNVVALAVIDVVEGSAMASLNMMNTVLRGRPQTFNSMERAIRWCYESNATRNIRAARVSMPSQIVLFNSNEKQIYRWRVNLTKSENYWVGWFRGISKKFLHSSPVKILILANADRLDKELLIGQMQGMFQYEVLPKVGHAVHEDSPTRVAEIFITMINKYKVIFNKTWK